MDPIKMRMAIGGLRLPFAFLILHEDTNFYKVLTFLLDQRFNKIIKSEYRFHFSSPQAGAKYPICFSVQAERFAV
jgi:hypothetical protein